jgi:hypothetical protein
VAASGTIPSGRTVTDETGAKVLGLRVSANERG